jgi:hypothetical protein
VLFITAKHAPSNTRRRSVGAVAAWKTRQGLVHRANTAAALAMRNQATPSTPTWGNRSTAKEGPR